jgi:hypothetical protein
MSVARVGGPYHYDERKAGILQPEIYPLPRLRRPWFRNKIVCKDGWSLAFSGSSWRIDRYDYFEDGKHLILGGEGACGTMGIIVEPDLLWKDPPNVRMDEANRARVLRIITAALQWAGFKVEFYYPSGGSR